MTNLTRKQWEVYLLESTDAPPEGEAGRIIRRDLSETYEERKIVVREEFDPGGRQGLLYRIETAPSAYFLINGGIGVRLSPQPVVLIILSGSRKQEIVVSPETISFGPRVGYADFPHEAWRFIVQAVLGARIWLCGSGNISFRGAMDGAAAALRSVRPLTETQAQTRETVHDQSR